MPHYGREYVGLDVGTDTKEVTLAWLEEALEHAYSHGQHLALAYLEAVIEDVVFEEEITARTASVVG
jgi:isocitrate dehydrogenase